MLSAKIKRILVVFSIILVIGISLFWGFRLGYGFIHNQNDRALAIESMEMAQIKQEAVMPTVTDENGNSYEVTPTPVPDDKKSKFEMPRHVRQDTPGAVEIYIEYGQDSKDIAETLLNKGIIDKTLPFIIMAELNGFDGSYRHGTHFVLRGMDYNEIMYNLSLPPETTWITFPEGFTYMDIKKQLREHGVNFDETKMDELINSPSLFKDYSYVTNIPTDAEGRLFQLEGYLFPDTYQFDLNVDEKDIIRVFLRNTENKITEDILDRAEELGMPLDQVLTLASIIQNEAGSVVEMYKVSRVFHNRLDNDDALQSCATSNYLRELNGKPKVWAATEEDMAYDSPYNTYKHTGLPPGPIGNPGLEAIWAALYPDDEDTDLYYFCAKGDGTNAFASSLEEHEQNVAEYSANWSNERE